jgi:hypothetical protein
MNDESEIPGTAAPAPAPEKQVRVLSCMQCESPVVSTAGQCQTCGTALSGDEFPYMPRQAAGPDINGLLKWWVIWCLGVWALAGFSFGIISSFLVSAVSAVYLVRILRAYYH